MLKDLTIKQFCDEVDSASPAPGGGSVAALVATLGISLTRMYAHLSIGKKRFLALDETTQLAFIEIFEQLKPLHTQLLEAVDKDSNAYNNVMKAIRMPKETEAEILLRNKAMDEANHIAIKTPYEVMELAYQAMKPLASLIPYGNKNAISDIGVGILLLDTALQGAAYNVRINLSSLKEDERIQWDHKMKDLLIKSNELKNSLLLEIDQYM
ncbi:MAG: cyclodeaminase/cyclohydrolase family protein [Erysipelotrichaceae bacterium]